MGLPFLNVLDLSLLDETQYCQIVLNIPDFDVSSMVGLDMYFSKQATDCERIMEVRELQSLNDEQLCSQPPKDQLIKDPRKTFLFWNSKNESLGTFYQKASCSLLHQPYFFVATQTSVDTFIMEEIQVYTKRKENVLTIKKQNEEWKVIDSSFSTVYMRRTDFHGFKVKALYANYLPWGVVDQSGRFVGYDGDIGTLVAEKLNLTLELKPIEVFGVKTKNGSYTGAIKDLKDNLVDIGMTCFIHLSERLEVTDGGYSNLGSIPELIYWKRQESKFIYGLVFNLESWCVIFVIVLTSAMLLLMKFKFHESSENIMTQLLDCVSTSLRSLVVLDIGGFDKKYLSIRIHLFFIALNGSMLFATYTGVLVSYFSSESTTPPITSLESIADMPNLNIMLLKEAGAHQHIMRALKNKPQLETIIQSKMKLFPNIPEMEEDFINTRFDPNHLVMFEVKMFLHLINS